MKKYLVILMLAPMMFGCNYHQKIEEITAEKEKLAIEAEAKDAAIQDFTKSLDEIETNLVSIKEKEGLISVGMKGGGSPELKATAKERIISDLKVMEDLMASNHRIINSLQAKVNKSDSKMKEFERVVHVLKQRVQEKDREYASLRTDLENSQFQIRNLTYKAENLEAENKTQSAIINNQYNELNTAYYTTGTYKELKDDKVLDKVGGVIGIGATKKLKSDFDKQAFTKIEIDKTQVIPVAGKKVSLITTHEPGSYRFESESGKVQRLVITDPENFWKASKYLVVVVDESKQLAMK